MGYYHWSAVEYFEDCWPSQAAFSFDTVLEDLLSTGQSLYNIYLVERKTRKTSCRNRVSAVLCFQILLHLMQDRIQRIGS